MTNPYTMIMCRNPRTFHKVYNITGFGLDDGLGQSRLLLRMLWRARAHGKGGAGSKEWKRYRRELQRGEEG